VKLLPVINVSAGSNARSNVFTQHAALSCPCCISAGREICGIIINSGIISASYAVLRPVLRVLKSAINTVLQAGIYEPFNKV